MSRAQGGQPSVLQELFLVGCSAILSMIVLNFGLKRLDPNRQTSKAAIERKKELASRLGRPNLDTMCTRMRLHPMLQTQIILMSLSIPSVVWKT